MAVYERTYKPFTGELTAQRSRFLILPRYAYEEVFRSKLFVGLLVAFLVWPLALACILYLPHNLSFLKAFGLTTEAVQQFFGFGENFFYSWFMIPHGVMAMILTIIVGPVLISTDARNNGLALYFARPFTRTEYVLGKMSVLVLLLSAITWIPGMGLFLLQCYLGGSDWIRAHHRVGSGILLGFGLLILLLCLISLAISAYVRWKPVSRLVLILLMWVTPVMALMINGLLQTSWASVVDLPAMIYVVWATLFKITPEVDVPAWAAWLSLLAWSGFSLLLLARKLRPYEVVR